MPQEKIIIKFVPDGHEKLIKALNNLARAQKKVMVSTASVATTTSRATAVNKKAAVAMNVTAKSAGILDTRNKRLAKTNGLLAMAFATLRSKLLLASFAMALFVRPLMSIIKNATKIDAMGRAFNTLSGGTMKASIAMSQLQKATNNTMSQIDLLKQANNAMVLGVSKSSEEMAEMFDIAQRLGRALGQDTAMSVESLITGIGRQSRLMLDNIGIIVKAEEAYEAHAEALGVNTDELTDAQKKQAFFNATMESARAKVALLGKETLTSEDSIQEFASAMKDFGAAVGTKVMPHLIDLLDFTTKIVTGWREFFEVVDMAIPGEAMDDYVQSFKGSEKAILKEIGLLEAERKILLKSQELHSNTASVINKTTKANNEFNQGTMQIVGIVNEANDGLSGLAQVFGSDVSPEVAKVATAFYLGEASLNDLLIAMENSMNVSTEFADNLAPVDTGVADLTARIVELQKELAKLQAGTTTTATDFAKNFSKMGTAAGSLSQSMATMAKGNLDQTIMALNLGKAQGVMNIIVGATAAVKSRGFIGFIEGAAVMAQGMAMIANIDQQIAQAKASAKMEQGGLIGGRRHSAGGTMINAEAGEFVMSRNAVESIGLENLNQMNEGGGSSNITLNISAPLVDDTVVDSIIPAIREAVRRGEDIGIS